MNQREKLLQKLDIYYGSEQNEKRKAQIKHIRDIVYLTPIETDFGKFPRIRCFLEREEDVKSLLDDPDGELKGMLGEVQTFISSPEVKVKAVYNMRREKRGRVIAIIALLLATAVAVAVLGLLSAFGIVDEIWCNIFGNLDCVLGIVFFVYEIADDKLKESAINSGDEETVKKYVPEFKAQTFGDYSPAVNGKGNKISYNIKR